MCYEADRLQVSFDISGIDQIGLRNAPYKLRSKNIRLNRKQAGKHTAVENTNVEQAASYVDSGFFRATFSH